MSDVRISELPAAEPLDGDEQVPVVQDGATRRTTAGALGGGIRSDTVRYVEATDGDPPTFDTPPPEGMVDLWLYYEPDEQ